MADLSVSLIVTLITMTDWNSLNLLSTSAAFRAPSGPEFDIGPEKVLIFDHRGAEKSIRLVGCSALVRPL